jgi:hypothetical protein
MTLGKRWLSASAVIAGALMLVGVLGSQTASAQPGPQAVPPPCPAPETVNGVDVCVDRGDGSVYHVGEPITVCVTVNIPQIAIFPPPPPPSVRVTSSVNGGPDRVLIEESFASGQRCINTMVAEPTGAETIRAVVAGTNGQAIASDTVNFTSVGQQPAVTADITIDRGPGSVYRQGEYVYICATVTPSTLPPPGLQARVLSFVNSAHVATFPLNAASGTQCFYAQISMPTGSETLRLDVLNAGTGELVATDSVSFFSF